jgi:hypothetical protein
MSSNIYAIVTSINHPLRFLRNPSLTNGSKVEMQLINRECNMMSVKFLPMFLVETGMGRLEDLRFLTEQFCDGSQDTNASQSILQRASFIDYNWS